MLRHYNYHNANCHTCKSWVWKGDGAWHRGLTYCRACWAKRHA